MGFGDEIKDVENAVDGQEYVPSFKLLAECQDLPLQYDRDRIY